MLILSQLTIWRDSKWRLFFAVFLTSLLFYVCLLPPFLSRGGDSGELIAASFTQGIAHPSGYALWCILGRLFAFVPFGEIAWRYNLFSAVCGAASVGLIALIVREIATHFFADSSPRSVFLAAVTGALLFAGFFFAASQFLIAEVYASAAFCGALLLFLALRWHFHDDWRDAYALAFVAGLAPLVHLSTVFYLPWLFVFAVWKKRFLPRHALALLGFFALGLAPISYFPLRSAPFPEPPSKNIAAHAYYPLDWTHPSDWQQLKTHVTAAQYRSLLIEEFQTVENGRTVTRKRLAQNPAELPAKFTDWSSFVALQFLWATPLIFVGIWQSARYKPLFALLLLVFVGNVGVQMNYKVPDVANFFFPAYVTMAIWMGLGWLAVFEWAQKRRAIVFQGVLAIALVTILTQWSIFASVISAKNHDLTQNVGVHQAKIAQKFAAQTGKPSFVFFSTDDWLWSFWYAKYVKNLAPNAHTPWGRRHYLQRKNGLWHRDVAAYKKHGAVFMTSWDEKTDWRFPYVLADDEGALWLASDQNLPDAARKTGKTASKIGVQNAKIRRGTLWKRAGSDAPITIQGTFHALDVEFAVPANWRATARKTAVQAGHIEFKMGKNSTPQRRRLILPLDWRTNQIFSATVPLEISIKARSGRYPLWARLVELNGKNATDWRRTDEIIVAQ